MSDLVERGTTVPVCCYCDAPLSCARCGCEQPADVAQASQDRIEALEAALWEDINILLNLLNPLHGELDKQSYDEKLSQNFDAPPDAEYNVNITAQMERDLTQAVLILESRRAAIAPEPDK